MINAIPQTLLQPHALTALESMPADLRLLLGWRRLFALTLDSVMAVAPETILDDGRTPILLTLTTYCYAANQLASDDIESMCRSYGDVAYITDGEVVSAAELRRFRRSHRIPIEGCLQRVFGAALEDARQRSSADFGDVKATTAAICEFTQRRLNLAVLFDTALSE